MNDKQDDELIERLQNPRVECGVDPSPFPSSGLRQALEEEIPELLGPSSSPYSSSPSKFMSVQEMEVLLSSKLVELSPAELKSIRQYNANASYPIFKHKENAQDCDLDLMSFLFDEIPFALETHDGHFRKQISGSYSVYHHYDRIDWGWLEGWEVPSTAVKRSNDKGLVVIGANTKDVRYLEGRLFYIPEGSEWVEDSDDESSLVRVEILRDGDDDGDYYSEEEEEEYSEEEEDNETRTTVDSAIEAGEDGVANVNDQNDDLVNVVPIMVDGNGYESRVSSDGIIEIVEEDRSDVESNLDGSDDDEDSISGAEEERSFGSDVTEATNRSDDSAEEASEVEDSEIDSDDSENLSQLADRLTDRYIRKLFSDWSFLHFDERSFVLDDEERYESASWFGSGSEVNFGLITSSQNTDGDSDEEDEDPEEEEQAKNNVTLFKVNETMAFAKGDKQRFISLERSCNIGVECGSHYDSRYKRQYFDPPYEYANNNARIKVLQDMQAYRSTSWICKLCPSDMIFPEAVGNLIREYWQAGPPPYLIVNKGDLLLLARHEEIVPDPDFPNQEESCIAVTREHVVLARPKKDED